MKIRGAIAVLVSRFPLITETFILRELIELERQGQPVLLVPMLRENPVVVHPEATPWVERAWYTPYLSAAILLENGRTLLKKPLKYLTLLFRLVIGSLRSPGFLARTIAIFPKTVYLARELEAQGVRHVHAQFATHPATMALIISELTSISFSITAHAHDIFVERALLPMKLRRASFLRAISKFNRDYLARLYPAAASRLVVIHVGVTADRVPPAEHAGSTVLCIAALKTYKGVPLLIEACATLVAEGVGVKCAILGDGPLRGEIEGLIRARHLTAQVELLGNRTQEEVAQWIARSAVVVLPSIVAPDGQMEGIPVALMEAMAAERPVVASRLSGIPELVEDGVTGILVEPGNAEALAGAIRQVLEDPSRARDMGRRGSERVRREFVLSATVEQLLERLDQYNEPPQLTREEISLLSAGSTADQAGIRRIHDRRDSRVIEALIGNRELILKVQKSREGESRPPAERARHEFDILHKLAESGCGVPRPIRLAGDAIVMERARGKSLDRLIRELRSRPAALEPSFRAAGAWLSRFQRAIPGGYHGDFWPGNVFVSADHRVEVIDFEGCRTGSPSRDVADFLEHSRGFFRRHPGKFAPLRDAFLSGYGELDHV